MHLGRVFLCLCGVYFAMLFTIIICGIIKYGYLRQVSPNQNLTSPTDALVWYSAYGGFLEISILLLALLVGFCAALFGIIKKSPLEGLGFLIVFVAFTYVCVSILPHFYYIGGNQGIGAYWIINGFYDYTGAWLLTTILGYFLRHRLKNKVIR